MNIQTCARLSSQYYAELAQALLGSPEVAARAALLANALRQALPGSACALYSLRTVEDAAFWAVLGVSEEISVADPAIPAASLLFAPLLQSAVPVSYAANQLAREDYAHLHVLRTIRSIGYLPLLREQQLVGAFEVVSFSDPLTEATLQSMEGLAELAATALGAAEQYEEQRQNLLDSIHRLTQLYDLEKSLNETLDFEPLLELIPVKVAAMLPCQAIHLWMFDGGRLRMVSSWGEDSTAEVGTIEEAGQGYVADMAEEGVPLLINEPDDPRLATRNERAGDGQPITNALLVPLIEHAPEGGGDSELGVLEAVNKAGGAAFTEDDLFFMNSMSETVSSALKNASLMYAERKLEILQALVQVSSEITSTLRLDRLLQIIVNGPQAVLPFERCSIALDNRGRLQLKAISGMANIPAGDLQVEQLRSLLQWISTYDRQLLVRQHEEEPETEDPRVRAAIGKHFEASGYRALYALPLSDDQGRVGLLLYESSDPDFLDQAHIEMIKVLAGQTTVAIRNALLYREVPLIGLLEPLVQRKQAFLRSDRKRQGMILGGIAAAILLLIFCPLPLRISGAAVVAPQSVATLAAPVEGTIAHVYAREGQHVRRGDILGTMDDWSWRNQLAAAEARYNAAMLAMQGDLARHSAQAGEDRTQADFLRAEMDRTRLRIANAELRSPIDGVVMTPDLQNAVGEHLDAGAGFAQVLDLSSARINIAVDQQDAYLVKAGQTAAIKLDSFPAQTLHGQVLSVSPEAQAGANGRVFYAHVLLPNQSAQLRTGMDGRAKIFAGYRPAGFVLLRTPALWLWEKLWDWIGW
ncbi:MAG TPA: GAF domain-containing protein [Acidobacteriaceae bacterium]|nr:GAF domain-containing protein [Acidobacteriaceae bacterium]